MEATAKSIAPPIAASCREFRGRRRQSVAFALFAEAVGALAKTDGVDARMLASWREPRSRRRPLPAQRHSRQTLRDRTARRDAAVAVRRRFQPAPGQPDRRPRGELAEIERQILAASPRSPLDAEIDRAIAADPSLVRRLAVLTSIPGIGASHGSPSSSACRTRRLSGKRPPLIAGLAPIACDSGEQAGARHIRGGRPQLRRALYMAALSATRCNPDLKAVYDRLRAHRKKAQGRPRRRHAKAA